MLDGNKGISDNRKIGRSNKVPHFDFRIVYGARCVTQGVSKRGIGSRVNFLRENFNMETLSETG